MSGYGSHECCIQCVFMTTPTNGVYTMCTDVHIPQMCWCSSYDWGEWGVCTTPIHPPMVSTLCVLMYSLMYTHSCLHPSIHTTQGLISSCMHSVCVCVCDVYIYVLLVVLTKPLSGTVLIATTLCIFPFSYMYLFLLLPHFHPYDHTLYHVTIISSTHRKCFHVWHILKLVAMVILSITYTLPSTSMEKWRKASLWGRGYV